jgi:hypothetical protein
VFTIDRKLEYAAINTQNRWMGVIFNSPLSSSDGRPLDKRIFFSCKGTAQDGRTAHNEMTGFASKSAMLVQRLPEAKNAGDMRIYFSKDIYNVKKEQDGWVFAEIEDAGAYAAVKPSRGSTAGWEAATGDINEGYWLKLSEQNVPVVVQLGLSSDYEDFNDFITDVSNNKFEWTDGNGSAGKVFNYEGCRDSGTITWSTDKVLPALNGRTVDLNPEMVYDCKYFSSDNDSGIVTVKNTENDIIELNFNDAESEVNVKGNRWTLWIILLISGAVIIALSSTVMYIKSKKTKERR